jgi:gamma-glutamyltranspeptidase/glutathione hydrolase
MSKRIQRLAAFLLVVLVALVPSACIEQRQGMVASANPHATAAAIAVLEAGGNALDAAIAAQLMLGLVEPQSSGIGSGLFLLHWNKASRKITAWDGRETAPAKAGPDLFLDASGEPLGWWEASIGGRPVGVPGAVAALWAAHQRDGKLDWAKLFDPAIRLAEDGFAVSPRLNQLIASQPRLAGDAAARQLYFVPEASAEGGLAAVPAGAILRNPAYAATLKTLADQGGDAFYKGEIAQAIVAAVANRAVNPGLMTPDDLAGYKAVAREAVCAPYRAYTVCGMPPPTSGGLTTLMILRLLEPYRMSALQPNGVMAVHLLSEAGRLAFADRDRYMADSDFVAVPVAGLLDRGYLRARARLIDPGRDMGKAAAGDPPRASARLAPSAPVIEYGTSHLSIVDGDGNAVSMTTSVEQPFGAHIMAAGFILNNQLTDFSFRPEVDGLAVANRVDAGKRPRSSMSPTLVFGPDGALFAAVGSPGGSRIIGYVAHSLIALIDWHMTMAEAVALPHALNRNGKTELEAGTAIEAIASALAAMGHEVNVRDLTSGLHGVRMVGGRMDGGADPRREGVVAVTGD